MYAARRHPGPASAGATEAHRDRAAAFGWRQLLGSLGAAGPQRAPPAVEPLTRAPGLLAQTFLQALASACLPRKHRPLGGARGAPPPKAARDCPPCTCGVTRRLTFKQSPAPERSVAAHLWGLCG